MTQTMFYPVSNRGGMGEGFTTEKECQDHCDSMSNRDVFWWAVEINTKLAEETRADCYF